MKYKGLTYFSRHAFSINEGGGPPGNVHFAWRAEGDWDTVPYFYLAVWLPWRGYFWRCMYLKGKWSVWT